MARVVIEIPDSAMPLAAVVARKFDAAWSAVLADDDLKEARRKLSLHELRLIIRHTVLAALDNAPPADGGRLQR